MSILLGFKRAKIQPFDSDGTPLGNLIVIEGIQDKGGTLEANISGLSSEPVKKFASNIAYYISQKGTGDVSVDFSALDMPNEAEARILGYTVDSALKAQFVGESTEPPYCAMTLESEDARGMTAIFGFFKGKFSRADLSLRTKEAGNFDPDGDSFTFSAIASDKDGKTNGSTMIKYLGGATGASAVENLVLTGSAEASIVLPDDFPTLPFRVFVNADGEVDHNYTFDQYKTGYTELYVAGNMGSDSTGDGTASKPFATLQKAVDTAEAGPDSSYIIKFTVPAITRNFSFAVATISKNISIVGTGASKTLVPMAVEQLAWTADGTGTWKATRSGVYSVFDLGATDTYGEPAPYTNVLTLAECKSKVMTWYTDDTTIWVHTLNGESPTINTHAVCINQNFIKLTVTNDATVYFENIRFMAGRENNGVNILGDGNIQGTFIANNCSFLGSNLRDTEGATKLGNAFAAESVKNVYLFNCIAAYSGRDCFNYHYELLWANSATKNRIRECVAVEFNCISYQGGIFSESGADNASTCHDGANIIRVGCIGSNTGGPVIHDAMGCLSYLLNCRMWDSGGTGAKRSAYYFDNDSAIADGAAWLIDCSGSGDNYSLNAAAGFKLYLGNFSGSNIPEGLDITYIEDSGGFGGTEAPFTMELEENGDLYMVFPD